VRTYSFVDLLDGRVPPSAIRGRVVVVGATAPRLQDVHATSAGAAPMGGPEINANAIATVLAGLPLRDAPAWADALLIVGLAALATLVGLRRSALAAAVLSLVLLAALAVGAQLLFAAGTVIPLVVPALVVVVTALACLAVGYWIVERERGRLRTEFARFVPAAVVGDVLEQVGEDQRLGGRRVHATVMFCDLRGFTELSERTDRDTLLACLNQYFDCMARPVEQHGGEILKFVGDAMLAMFPLEDDQACPRALQAALDARAGMDRLNSERTGRGEEALAFGIALHAGDVMYGNIGAANRLDFTVIGPAVNLASRLERLCRTLGFSFLISDTFAGMCACADYRSLGRHRLLGIARPVEVFTVPEAA
jgi:adenylate cyclase